MAKMMASEFLRQYKAGRRDFCGVNLSGATLSNAKLSWADLIGATLREVNLSGAELHGVNLIEANLREVNLSNANLRWANLSGANLREANLSNAKLCWAILRDANLTGTKGLPAAPVVHNIDAAILAAIEAGGQLAMDAWHSCETTHCRAGWAIALAGDAGRALEEATSPYLAGRLIYEASRPGVPAPDFFATTEAALADLRVCARA